jgi:hypothetical protein
MRVLFAVREYAEGSLIDAGEASNPERWIGFQVADALEEVTPLRRVLLHIVQSLRDGAGSFADSGDGLLPLKPRWR